jgi:hypothetical protein
MIFSLVITKKDPAATTGRGGRIRCPKCAWEPRAEDRWCCEPGCGHAWNTFETRGCCPGCGKQWAQTICLRCHQWSRHDDWYVEGDGP